MSQRNVSVLRPGQAVPPRGPFVLAVPGHLAPVQHFDLPANVKGAARLGIARQQLADRIGAAADQLMLLPCGGGLWDQAVVCDPAQVADCCNSDAARHKRCRGVVPDMLTLPFAPDTLVLDSDTDDLRARVGAYDGFTAPVSIAPALLQTLLTDRQPTQVHYLSTPSEPIRAMITAVGLTQVAAPPSTDKSSVPDLRETLVGNAFRDLWPWAAAAVLAVLAFGLWAVGIILETRELRADATATRTQTMVVLREGLIPQGPVLDIRQQVAQAQAARTGDADGDSPVTLLSRVTVALFGTGVTVGAIRLDPATNGLDVGIKADSFAAVDALIARFADSALLASTRDSRNETGAGVTARLIIVAEDPA